MVFTSIVLVFATYLTLLFGYGVATSSQLNSDVTLMPVSRGYRIPFSKISILLSPPAAREDARGLTGDPCFASLNCTGGRLCRGITGAECSVQSDVPCGLCLPLIFKFCSKHSQCDPGEVCARTAVDPSACLSSSIVSEENIKMGTPLFFSTEDDEKLLRCRASDENQIDIDPRPSPASGHEVRPYPSYSLSFGNCSRSSDCLAESECIYGKFDFETGYECCAGRDRSECYCLPRKPEPCTNDFDCSEIGEFCMEAFGKPARCVSRDNSAILSEEWNMHAVGKNGEDTRTKTDETGQNSTVSENSCIGLHHLNEMSPGTLLYKTHRFARVLCDEQNSCATPGHIVKYNRISMMMSTYCDIGEVNCSAKIMKVNSPRYSVALEVLTLTEGLAFTAFSARHGTRYEELVLSGLIRIGL
ncbi:unnamed protein product [Agarophyton chilense]